MRMDTRVANDLSEYFEAVNMITNNIKSPKRTGETNKQGKDVYHPPVLWFRGIDSMQHSLIPSLFRTKTRVSRVKNFDADYSALHYAEDIRTQHYIAKNYHFFQSEPSSRVEWLEVMQHHNAKTRVLDWSESSIHSLLFAIEMFLDNSKYNEQIRDKAVPCVWVLEPAELNRKIFLYLRKLINDNNAEILKLIDEMSYTASERNQVLKNFKRFSCFDIFDQTQETAHLDYILDLSAINDEILRDRQRLKKLLLSGDIVNPYYYLLSRIYSDGHILTNRKLPPLAVVHPYHSERIKAQRGVFTVFPFYNEEDDDEACREIGFNPDAMDNNEEARKVLHRIVIGNPRKVAYELMQNGMNDSWLYPELPVVSSEIENHQIY